MVPRERIQGEKFYSIGEVAEMTGVKPNILRYWEQEFKELNPLRRKKGAHRLYGGKQIAMVKSIHHLLREEGLSIAGARKRLSESRQQELPFTGMTVNLKASIRSLREELDALEALLKE